MAIACSGITSTEDEEIDRLGSCLLATKKQVEELENKVADNHTEVVNLLTAINQRLNTWIKVN